MPVVCSVAVFLSIVLGLDLGLAARDHGLELEAYIAKYVINLCNGCL